MLGVLCQYCGPDVYVELQSVLVSGIENNIERDAEAVLEHPELLEKLSRSSSSSASDGNERVSQNLRKLFKCHKICCKTITVGALSMHCCSCISIVLIRKLHFLILAKHLTRVLTSVARLFHHRQ